MNSKKRQVSLGDTAVWEPVGHCGHVHAIAEDHSEVVIGNRQEILRVSVTEITVISPTAH